MKNPQLQPFGISYDMHSLIAGLEFSNRVCFEPYYCQHLHHGLVRVVGLLNLEVSHVE